MSRRWDLLDFLRGFTVLSMVGYHAAYDAVLFGARLPWLMDTPGQLWQMSICCTFFLLSGFCHGFSRRPLRHAGILLASGLLVSLVTTIAMPGEQIHCGVLTGLGLCSLVVTGLHRLPKAWKPTVPPFFAACCALLLFLLLYHVPEGTIGLFGKAFFRLPKEWYQLPFGYLLGLPSPWFFSADYFPVIPWVFLYLTGYFLCGGLSQAHNDEPRTRLANLHFRTPAAKPFLFLGRHSLWVYLAHQPLLMGVFTLMDLANLIG